MQVQTLKIGFFINLAEIHGFFNNETLHYILYAAKLAKNIMKQHEPYVVLNIVVLGVSLRIIQLFLHQSTIILYPSGFILAF